MRKLAGMVALTLAASTVSVGVVGTAAQAAVPSCVTVSQWTSGIWDYARAHNGCQVSPRMYMQWDYAQDGDCETIAVGANHTESRGRQATFRGLYSC